MRLLLVRVQMVTRNPPFHPRPEPTRYAATGADSKYNICSVANSLMPLVTSYVVYGISPSLNEQKETLECLFQGRDTLSLRPTGYGKTLSFEGLVLLFDYLFNGDPRLPGRLRPSDPAFCNPVLVVISPLTQLILRQVADFNTKMTSGTTKCTWLNAICAYTSEGTVADAKSDTARRIYSGKANVVFLSPGLVTKKGRYRKILTSAAYT